MRRLFLLSLLLVPGSMAAQQPVDTTGAGRLIVEALERSDLMGNLQYLSDMIGPRLSGSPAMRRANAWFAEKFRGYGLTPKRTIRFILSAGRSRGCSAHGPMPRRTRPPQTVSRRCWCSTTGPR